jgi:hypothetical protein
VWQWRQSANIENSWNVWEKNRVWPLGIGMSKESCEYHRKKSAFGPWVRVWKQSSGLAANSRVYTLLEILEGFPEYVKNSRRLGVR